IHKKIHIQASITPPSGPAPIRHPFWRAAIFPSGGSGVSGFTEPGRHNHKFALIRKLQNDISNYGASTNKNTISTKKTLLFINKTTTDNIFYKIFKKDRFLFIH